MTVRRYPEKDMHRVYVREYEDETGSKRSGYLYIEADRAEAILAKKEKLLPFDQELHIDDYGPDKAERYGLTIENIIRSSATLDPLEKHLKDWSVSADRWHENSIAVGTVVPWEFWSRQCWIVKDIPLSTKRLTGLFRLFCDVHLLPYISADELIHELDDFPHARGVEPWIQKLVRCWEHAQGLEDEAASPLTKH